MGLVTVDKLDYRKDGLVVTDGEIATSVDRVFGISDIRNNLFEQVVVATSDGCIAAMSLDQYLKYRKIVRVDLIHE